MLDNCNSRHGIPFGWHLPTQRMVHADQVVNGRACECVCVACGGRLVARQGAIRVWHFAHGVDSDCQHATEAAIHRMAKQLIAERGCLFVPAREMSRTIYGKRRVWEETLTVEVQSAGVQTLLGCEVEKTIGTPKTAGEFCRPDVLGVLDGHPLAIEILNTHAVDHDKLQWLEQRQHSVLEIDVGDIAFLPPDQLLAALETRLFQNAEYSSWLSHAKDRSAYAMLDELETETRRTRFDEEQRLLAKLEADEAERKRREEFRKLTRDVEDFKIRFGAATVRVGRNAQRASLKIHGFAQKEILNAVNAVARRHAGRFIANGKYWEFRRKLGVETIFSQLCAEVEIECLEGLYGYVPPPAPTTPTVHNLSDSNQPTPLPIYFSEPALQEYFDERAGIREFDAGTDRESSEQLAQSDVAAVFELGGIQVHSGCTPGTEPPESASVSARESHSAETKCSD